MWFSVLDLCFFFLFHSGKSIKIFETDIFVDLVVYWSKGMETKLRDLVVSCTTRDREGAQWARIHLLV